LAEALIGLGLVEVAAGQFPAACGSLDEAVALARQSDHREGLAAGLAALARAERQGGDPASALIHACEAVRITQASELPVCEMWGEMEAGLALLAQGEPAAALEHTERAIALLPQAHEGWIGTEEVHRAHARVLGALGRLEAADEHARRAEAIVEAKAGHIPDPELRWRYLQSVKREA
ncbi:MAG: tetratricopeptide repeat protein, partial [Anaerolineae bacterium]